jgi:O-Antigen ligase
LIVLSLMVLSTIAMIAIGARGTVKVLPLFTALVLLMPNRASIPFGSLFDLNMQRLFVVMLFVIYARDSSPTENEPIHDRRWLDIPFLKLILINLAAMSISTIFSVNLPVSLKNLLMHATEYYLIYVIFCESIRTTEDVENIIHAVYAAVILLAILAVIETYTGWNPVNYLPNTGGRFFQEDGSGIDLDRGFRPTGVFPVSHLLGAAMVLGMTFTCYILTREDVQGWKAASAWILLLVMGLCLYKTSTRGPWIAIVLSYGFLLVASSSRIRRTIVIFGAFTGVFILIRRGVYDTIERIVLQSFDTNTSIGSSYEYRYALIDVARDALGKDLFRTLFGYGPESFFYLNLKSEFLGMEYTFLSCDSSWIQSAIETGLLGFSVLAILLGGVFLYQIYHLRKMSGKSRDMMACLAAFNLAFLFLMTNLAIYGWVQFGHVYWILTAMSIMIVEIWKKNGDLMEEMAA